MTVQQSIVRPGLPGDDASDAGQEGGGEFNLSILIRMLFVRRRIIVGTMAAVVAATALVVFSTTPLYDAKALVMLDQRQNKVVDVDAVLSGLSTDQTSIENQLQILRSRSLMGRVVAKLHLDEPLPVKSSGWALADLNPLSWFSPQPPPKSLQDLREEARNKAIDRLLASETVTAVGRSSAMEIKFRSSNPEKAMETANAIADAYVEDQLNAKFEATQKTSQWLADRLQTLQQQMQAADAAVQEYKAVNGITETGTGGSILDQQLAELNGQLITAKAQLATAEAKYSQVRAAQAAGRAEDVAQVFQSGMIEQLRQQQDELLRQKAELSTTFGPRHPKMLDIESQLRNIEAKIDEEVKRVVETVANDVSVAAAQVHSLEASMANLESQSTVQSRAKVGLAQLEARSASSHQLYEAFLSKFKETQGQEGIQTPDARIISKADLPTTPAVPEKMQDLLLALVGGLLAGLGIAFALERIDNGFRTAGLVEQRLGVPVLTTLPELTDFDKTGGDAADRIIDKPLSSYSEAIRGLQMSLALSNVDQKPKTFLVTSSLPDEGKTTVALSLARMMARTEKRVLLIDGDLRRPSIAKHFQLGKEHKGLVQLLSGEASFEECLVKDPRSNLLMLTSSHVHAHSGDLLASDAMEKVMTRAKAEFDAVVVDSAPLLPVNDTKVLAQLVDTVVFVVRWEKTARDAVAHAARALADVKAPVAGVVLSRADVHRHRYYSYGYQTYYGYNKYYTD